jgi:hypothetical protein
MADNLVLGRGELYFDPFLSGTTTKTGERYIGNTTEININVESDKLDHFSSDRGIREKDRSVILELRRQGTFSTDNMATENLAMFLLGDVSTVTQTSTPVVGEAINDVIKGRYYQIGATAGNPQGVRAVSSVTVKKGASTLVLNTDYSLDTTLGRIRVLEGSVTVSNGDDLTVDYTPAANSRSRIVTGASAEIKGALRYISYNPEGEQRDMYIPYALITPNGDLAMKGEEWQQASFNIEVQKLDNNTAAIYLDGRPA